MDEQDPRSGDPFQPALRSEEDGSVSADDGGASRRAAQLERLGYLASRSLSILILLGAGAVTARVIATEPPVPIDAPTEPLTATTTPEVVSDLEYPALGNLLGEDAAKESTPRRSVKGAPKTRRTKVHMSARPIVRQGGPTSAEPGTIQAAPAAPVHQKGQPADGAKKEKERTKKEEERPKPEPVPQPDRNLFHVWKQGTTDHIYYWEEWKTVEYFAPQEYYLYRDGNGSEGSFFSEQVDGTIPLRTDDGLLGYVYSQGGEGRTPLFYLRGPNQKRKRDLFTTDGGTKAAFMNNGWADYGIVGYLGAPFEE